MKNIFINLATYTWEILPVPFLRASLWKLFLWKVREKKTITTVDGITFDLDLSELIDVCLYVNRFEKDVTSAINAICQEKWVVLDIGANIGAHTLRFASLVGDNGGVFAFEPMGYAFQKLQRNVRLNQFCNIKIFQLALSNQNLPQQNISYRASWKTDNSRTDESSTVDFIRLDDWFKNQTINRLDFIKIDVDGNEYSVFDGAREVLEKYKPAMIAEVGAYHFSDSLSNPWEILENLGYRFWDVHTRNEYRSLPEMLQALKGEETINIIASAKSVPGKW